MNQTIWKNKKLGVIGGGNMAEALIRGVIASGLLPTACISVCDPIPERVALFRELGCVGAENREDVAAADVVLVATKPQVVLTALGDLTDKLRSDSLIVSIAAGVTTERIESVLPRGARVIRVMPNTPLLVGMGMSVLCRGQSAAGADMELALALFRACGAAVETEERDLDGVTALSGSGPAYLFRFAEALMAGGAGIGLPPELAKVLTVNTLRGAAEMLARNDDAATLRERVTSPGGTTAAALEVFDERGLMAIAAEALEAARRRSEELGRGR